MMNSSLFVITRLRKRLRVVLSALALLSAVFVFPNNSAVGQVDATGQYQLVWIPTAPGYINHLGLYMDADGMPETAYVVGWLHVEDGRQAYIYDHLGTIDSSQPGKLYDLQAGDLGVSFPPAWKPDAVESSFVGVNSSGRIVGYIKTPDGKQFGFYLDLFPEDSLGNPIPREMRQIATPIDPALSYRGQVVNELGDILVRSFDGNGDVFPYIFNPETEEIIDIPVVSRGSSLSLNSLRQVLGLRNDDVPYRHTLTSPDGSGTTELFPNFSIDSISKINEFGEFAARVEVLVPDRRGKKQTLTSYPVRVATDGSIGWQGESPGKAVTINNSGDLIRYNSLTGEDWLHQDNLTNDVRVYDLIADPELDFPASALSVVQIGDRDVTGLSWILGRADTDNSGGIDKHYLLIPISQTPVAGISVSPNIGLVTSELGGSDSFEVVLDTEPTADVTIGISTADATEGTVDLASLTFTPANWDTPQTVTVTGVDDADTDGDIEYSIFLDPVGSDDLVYANLDPAVVTVTNLDNDGSGGGGNGNGKGKNK